MAFTTPKAFEDTLKADEGLRRRYEETLKRVIEAGEAASDGEAMQRAAAQLGYELSLEELEQAWADMQQLDDAEDEFVLFPEFFVFGEKHSAGHGKVNSRNSKIELAFKYSLQDQDEYAYHSACGARFLSCFGKCHLFPFILISVFLTAFCKDFFFCHIIVLPYV